MKRVLLFALLLTGCIGWEEPRPYDEFVSQYNRYADLGYFDPEDAGTDTGTTPVDAGADATADADVDAGTTGFQPDPSWPPCSLAEAGSQVEVTFVNDTGFAGALNWIDSNCDDHEVGLAAPGGEVVLMTYVGHRFRLRLLSGSRDTVGGAYVADDQTVRLNLSGAP